MATSYTALLGFALPVTGELQGTWGDTVNNSITQLAEDSIAGVATASVAAGDWTLSTTGSGATNEARKAILIPTGSPGVSRNIICPSQSKAYIVVNQSNAAVVVKGSATPGVTIATGDKALVAWNGTDFVLVASSLSYTNLGLSGNLAFSSTSNRITGDFSNATLSSRVLLQTSTTNSNTRVGVIPNGTGNVGQLVVYGGSDPANTHELSITANAGETRIWSSANGTGSYQPLLFLVNAAERLRIDTSGNVTLSSAGGLGYGTGSGGTVTQATSKTTTVALNKPTGQVTMNNAALAAATSVSFQLQSTNIGANDVMVVAISGGVASADSYRLEVRNIASGAAVIRLTNISAGSLSEAVVFNYALIKGATA